MQRFFVFVILRQIVDREMMTEILKTVDTEKVNDSLKFDSNLIVTLINSFLKDTTDSITKN